MRAGREPAAACVGAGCAPRAEGEWRRGRGAAPRLRSPRAGWRASAWDPRLPRRAALWDQQARPGGGLGGAAHSGPLPSAAAVAPRVAEPLGWGLRDEQLLDPGERGRRGLAAPRATRRTAGVRGPLRPGLRGARRRPCPAPGRSPRPPVNQAARVTGAGSGRGARRGGWRRRAGVRGSPRGPRRTPCLLWGGVGKEVDQGGNGQTGPRAEETLVGT